MKRKSVPTSMHKKKELGGSCGIIKGDDLRKATKNRFDVSLMGKVHGDLKYNRKKAKKDLNSRIKEYYK